MNKVLALIFCALLSQAFASPAGIWTTVDDKTGKKRALIKLYVRDDTLYGKILRVNKEPGDSDYCRKCPDKFKGKPIVGLNFVWGLKDKGKNVWGDGEILDAKTGKIYRVKMTEKGDKLYVRGYIGMAMLGRTQVWLKGDKLPTS